MLHESCLLKISNWFLLPVCLEPLEQISEDNPHPRRTSLPVQEASSPAPAEHSPSPAKNPHSEALHVKNLVRPFMPNQLKDLLGKHGTLAEDGFWIDKIKSHCYVVVSVAYVSRGYKASWLLVVGASDQCTEGHGFDSRRGLIFFVPRSWQTELTSFSILEGVDQKCWDHLTRALSFSFAEFQEIPNWMPVARVYMNIKLLL